jgi:hypothetical protein
MPDRVFSKAEIAAMNEIHDLGVHPNHFATFPDGPVWNSAPPELIAAVEEIRQRYGIRELRPGYWGIEEETPPP